MNRKGFTLVEILAVLVLIALVTVLAVTGTNSVNKRSKERLLNTKIVTAEEGLKAWNNDNENCFRSNDAVRCMIGMNFTCEKADSVNCCMVDSHNSNLLNCSVTFGTLASANIIKYDDIINEIVKNPVDGSSLNDRLIRFIYDKNNRIFTY